MSILFNEIVFGPVHSRRLGVSLGINLMPLHSKICSYDCVYCECGLNAAADKKEKKIFTAEEIMQALNQRFDALHKQGLHPDSITFSGNGEPTLHPGFEEIIDETIRLRNIYFPKAKISVLSNASQLHKDAVKKALLKVDNALLKLDAGTDKTFQLIDCPNNLHLDEVIKNLKSFNGQLIIQTILVRGDVKGVYVDNTTEEELSLYLKYISEIKPQKVMLYPIDRETPYKTLEKVPREIFENLAERIEKLGIEREIAY